MRHTESYYWHTLVHYEGQAKLFWGWRHRERALDFFYNLPAKDVIIVGGFDL